MLTVSIVTFRVSLPELAQCLDSLRSDAIGRIYVVDNAAEPRVEDFLATRPEPTVYIPSANRGYGAGHNQALRQALADPAVSYHLVVNSDVRFDPAIIRRIVDFMDANPDVGLLQPRIEYPDGRLQYTARRLPAPLDVFGRRFLPNALIRKRNRRYLMVDTDHSRPFQAPYFQGSFMFLRIEALRQVGLFDERFFMYPEDIDLTRRIHAHWQTLYWPEVTIVHDHRAASYRSLRMLWIHCVNMVRYFNKWGWLCDPERRKING